MKTTMRAFSKVVSRILENGEDRLLSCYSDALMFGGSYLTMAGIDKADCLTCFSWLVLQSGKHVWAYEVELGALATGIRMKKEFVTDPYNVANEFVMSYVAAFYEGDPGLSDLRKILVKNTPFFRSLLSERVSGLVSTLAVIDEEDLFN